MLTYCRLIRKINMVLGWVAAPLIGAVTAIVLYEVVVRYFFQAPTSWAQEVCEYLLCSLVMLGSGYTLSHSGHTRVDILFAHMSPKAQAWVDILTALFLILATLPIIWLGTRIAFHAFMVNDLSSSAAALPLWPAKASVPVGALFLLGQGIGNALEKINFLISGDQPQHS